MAADAGMRSGAQRQASEAGGRQVQVTSTSGWAELSTGRGGGERVKLRGFQRGKSMDGEEVGNRGERTIQITGEEKVGAES